MQANLKRKFPVTFIVVVVGDGRRRRRRRCRGGGFGDCIYFGVRLRQW